jgi:histidinol phosphatase-like PHP family hydrolase
VLPNGDLAVLLWNASRDEKDHRRRALERASRAARFWPEEAGEVAAAGRSLTELRAVGPWVAAKIHEWLDASPVVPEADETQRDFLTYAEVRRVLDADPSWETEPHGDLQVHSTDSDGSLPFRDMATIARELGRRFMSFTDHSKSLTIAGGQDEERLADQGQRIDEYNAELEANGQSFRVLRSIEMDIAVDGTGDMDPHALRQLDLVLGAFHSALRVKEEQTERYIAALNNPTIHVLAHPKARMFGRRTGLQADWPRVFDEAARLGKAIEIDATPNRQDLNVELARIAVASGVRWYSIGSDAHSALELEFLPFGMAIASLAGVPRERVLNYLSADEVIAWARRLDETS